MAGEPRRRCGPAEESRCHCLGGERRKSRLPKKITFTPVCKCACRLAEGRASPVQPPSHSQKLLAICHGPDLPTYRKLPAGLLWTGHLRHSPPVARSCLLACSGPGVSNSGKLLASPWRTGPAGGGSKSPQLSLTLEVGMAHHRWGYPNKNHLQPQPLQRASQRRKLWQNTT